VVGGFVGVGVVGRYEGGSDVGTSVGVGVGIDEGTSVVVGGRVVGTSVGVIVVGGMVG
jgi:hypothetical protein